jgi:hypothetical protein
MSVGWIFLGAVAVFVVYAAVQLWRYRGSSTWPTTNGVIEGEPEMHSWDDGHSRYATVFYSYSAAGERYSGEWNTPSFPTDAKVREFLTANMPKGSAVVVRYRADKAGVSTLEADATAATSGDGPIKLGL